MSNAAKNAEFYRDSADRLDAEDARAEDALFARRESSYLNGR